MPARRRSAPSSLETPEQLFDRIVSLNFKGPFRLMSLVGSRMAAGEGGSIINISSAGALRPRPQIAPYAGAKAALNAITEAFAFEYGPKVRVNTISPGRFLTDVSKAWSEEHKLNATAALKRSGRPEEIVTAALYLASSESSFTTGSLVRGRRRNCADEDESWRSHRLRRAAAVRQVASPSSRSRSISIRRARARCWSRWAAAGSAIPICR